MLKVMIFFLMFFSVCSPRFPHVSFPWRLYFFLISPGRFYYELFCIRCILDFTTDFQQYTLLGTLEAFLVTLFHILSLIKSLRMENERQRTTKNESNTKNGNSHLINLFAVETIKQTRSEYCSVRERKFKIDRETAFIVRVLANKTGEKERIFIRFVHDVTILTMKSLHYFGNNKIA